MKLEYFKKETKKKLDLLEIYLRKNRMRIRSRQKEYIVAGVIENVMMKKITTNRAMIILQENQVDEENQKMMKI